MELQNPTNLSKKIQDHNSIFQGSKDIYLPSTHTDMLSSPNPVNLIEENIQKRNNHMESSSKTKYSKISNIKRKELIDAVENQGEKLKDAAVRLNLNYSSAKSIIRVFKKEGRYNKKPAINRYTNKPKPEIPQDQANLELPLDNLTPVYSLPFLEDNNSLYMKKNMQSEAKIIAESKNLEELRAELLKSQLEKRPQTNDFFESPLIKGQAVSYENELKGSFQNFVPNLDFNLKMQQDQGYSLKDLVNLPNIPITLSDIQDKNLSYPFAYETVRENNNFAASPLPINQLTQYQSPQILQPPFFPSNQYYTVIFPNNQIHPPYNFIPNPNIHQLQGHMPMQQIFIMTPVMPVDPHPQFNQQQNVDITFLENPNQAITHPNL